VPTLSRLVMAAWAAVALTSCAVGADGPTFPTAALQTIQPFIVGSPGVFATGSVPDQAGVWRGSMVLAACRSRDGHGCKADYASSRAVRLVITQSGTTLTGRLSMNEPDGPEWPFGGYVTATGGIAGQANVDASTRVVLRLTPAEGGLAGEAADELWVAAALATTRHWSVAERLARADR
jgi:hypothetical protein